jgi:hypothetical protein
LVDATESLNFLILTHDKINVALSSFVSLAKHSNLSKAATAQILPRGSGRQAAEPDSYPAAYAASRTDMILCGLRPHYLPPDATHVTFTGVFSIQKMTVLSQTLPSG